MICGSMILPLMNDMEKWIQTSALDPGSQALYAQVPAFVLLLAMRTRLCGQMRAGNFLYFGALQMVYLAVQA